MSPSSQCSVNASELVIQAVPKPEVHRVASQGFQARSKTHQLLRGYHCVGLGSIEPGPGTSRGRLLIIATWGNGSRCGRTILLTGDACKRQHCPKQTDHENRPSFSTVLCKEVHDDPVNVTMRSFPFPSGGRSQRSSGWPCPARDTRLAQGPAIGPSFVAGWPLDRWPVTLEHASANWSAVP